MAPVRSHILGALVVGLVPMAAILMVTPAVAQIPTSALPIDRWQPFIAEASRRFGIPEAWIRAVMAAESGGQAMLDGRPITSRAGAMGLMQVIPSTWAELRDRYGLGADPYDPRDNILAGAAYLRELYERYGYPNLYAAYNAGPARLDGYLFNGRPLPDETRAYFAALGQPGFEPSRIAVVPSGNSLFVTLHNTANGMPALPAGSFPDGLFLPLSSAPEREP